MPIDDIKPGIWVLIENRESGFGMSYVYDLESYDTKYHLDPLIPGIVLDIDFDIEELDNIDYLRLYSNADQVTYNTVTWWKILIGGRIVSVHRDGLIICKEE